MPNKTLTLSIVIPVYNEEDYLPACLDAIARQTVMPDQVIVVDNNSTDCSANIGKRYKFAEVIKEEQQGVVFARNRGFDYARGRLIGRIDADTILPPDWVKRVKEVYVEAGRPRLLAVTAPSSFRNLLSGICYILHRLTYFWPSRLLLGHITLVGSNMFITKQLWKAIEKDVCLRADVHEDMDLAHHAAKAGARLIFEPSLKGSVVARKMLLRIFEYPRMMWRVRAISH